MKFLVFLFLLVMPMLVRADAVIFSGSDVKTLKQNIDLFGVAKILSGTVNPSSGGGVAAPQGSIYLSTTAGLFEKTGAGNTAWTKVQLKPVSLTADVSGVLPIANGGTNLSTIPTNGQLLIGNGTGYSLSTLTGTTDQVNVTNAAGSITLSLPQSIATTSTPTFNDVQVSGSGLGNIQLGQEIARNSSTGVRSGMVLSINADPSKFDITAGTGKIVNPVTPSIIPITYAGATAVTVTNLATSDYTYLLINSSGSLVQQTAYPTPDERRDNIFIGRLTHQNRTTITFANTAPDFLNSTTNQLFDFFDAMQPFKVGGLEITANGANLSFNKASGTAFFRSGNYVNDVKNPHILSFTASSPQSFRKMTRTTIVDGSDVTVIDPANYDNAGTVTAVGGGAGSATIQRIFLYKSGGVRVAYGQTVYSSLATALSNLGTDSFFPNPTIEQTAILVGYIVVTRTATDLSDTSQARVLNAARFDAGGSASIGGTTSLQGAYNNSTQPQIVLNTTQGTLQIADNATPIASDLFEVINNAGTTEYLKVDTAGTHTTNFTGTGTTGAVRFHNLTTTQRNALTPAAGMEIYNTTTSQFECYITSWLPCAATRSVNSNLTLAASSSISIITTSFVQTWRVQGNSAAVTLSTTPFGSTAPLDGARITIIGNSATNTVTFVFNDAAKGYVGPDITLGLYDSITVEYNSTLDRYILVSRSN